MRSSTGPLPFAAIVLVVLAALAVSTGCDSSNGSQPDPPPAPPAADQSLVARVVGESSDEIAAGIRRGDFFGRILPRLEGWEARVATKDGPGGRDGIEVVAGLLPWSAAEARRAAGLPVDLAAAVVSLDGATYDDPRVTLTLRVSGEEDDGSEVWLVAGTDPEAVAAEADRTLMRAAGVRFWGQQTSDEVDYVVRESSYVLRTGSWDGGDERDDFTPRAQFLASLRPVDPETTAVRLLAPPGLDVAGVELPAVARQLDRSGFEMARRLPGGEGLLADPVTVAVEPDFVSQGRHGGALGPAVEGGGGGMDLHAVLHPDDLWGVRFRLARHLLDRAGLVEGTPVWLADGAALVLAGDWTGRPWREWLPVLAAAGALPGPEDAPALLASERTGDASEPLWMPAAAAVVEAMPGDDLAAKLRAAAGATPEELAPVLARLAERAPDAPEPSTDRPLPAGFLAGVSFAMVNDLEGGYHAPAIAGELDRLATLGANAVSLMPFAFQRDPRRPELRFLNDSPSSETDAGLVHATRTARDRGFTVLTKPHIWLPGSWPGEVEMTTAADWDAWWRSYRRYVLHHALLAAYAGADLFSIGVELEKTVGQEARWEQLAADVKRLFSGPVLYAANWYRGAEEATFWDRLDAVGVDAYYPLAPVAGPGAPEPSDDDLAEGARRAVAKLRDLARRTGKPVILTEVGFAARSGAWDEPHREGGDLSVEDQARSYRALFGALRSAEADQLRGVFVWKAFSGPRRWRGGDEAAGRPDFQFLDRPAEESVRGYFETVGDD